MNLFGRRSVLPQVDAVATRKRRSATFISWSLPTPLSFDPHIQKTTLEFGRFDWIFLDCQRDPTDFLADLLLEQKYSPELSPGFQKTSILRAVDTIIETRANH